METDAKEIRILLNFKSKMLKIVDELNNETDLLDKLTALKFRQFNIETLQYNCNIEEIGVLKTKIKECHNHIDSIIETAIKAYYC